MKRFGLIGASLTHSFSRNYFTEKFEQLGLPWQYDLFPLQSINELPALLEKYPDLCGLNVTIPYKKQVLNFLHQVSGEALETGVVNVIDIYRENDTVLLSGMNTDIPAFRVTLEPLLQQYTSRAIIFGTGASSDSVAHVLDGFDINYIRASRQEYYDEDIFLYEELTAAHFERADLIINTTPAGMFPNTEERLPFNPDWLKPYHIVYDLVYNPAETNLLRDATLRGCKVKNGLEMLYLQAELSWKIWNKH